jgi:hypothetical protein
MEDFNMALADFKKQIHLGLYWLKGWYSFITELFQRKGFNSAVYGWYMFLLFLLLK